MAHMNSAGQPQRTLTHRRQRPVDTTPMAPVTPSSVPEKTAPSTSSPALQPNQANLRSPTESDRDLPVLTELFSDNAFEAFAAQLDRTSAEQSTDQVPPKAAKPGHKDSSVKINDWAHEIANPNLGTGVIPITQHVLAGDTYTPYPMGASTPQWSAAPGHLIEPDPVKITVEELCMPVQTSGTAPLAEPAANTPPTHPGASDPARTVPQQPALVGTPPLAPQPDTSNDRQIALKEQIKESVADLAFFADIENRLTAILDKYKDPKGEVKALRAETRHYVSALTLQCGEYKTDYVKAYGHLDDPMLEQLDDLAKKARGNQAEPLKRTHAEQRRDDYRGARRQLDYRPADLRKRFREELTVQSKSGLDAQSEGDSSMESDPKEVLTRHSNTAHRLHRKTKELEAALMLADDDGSGSISEASQQQFESESIEGPRASQHVDDESLSFEALYKQLE